MRLDVPPRLDVLSQSELRTHYLIENKNEIRTYQPFETLLFFKRTATNSRINKPTNQQLTN